MVVSQGLQPPCKGEVEVQSFFCLREKVCLLLATNPGLSSFFLTQVSK